MPKIATAHLVDLAGVIPSTVTSFYMKTSQENMT